MFEEVKEMIDSTVYPNGNGEITAQNINLALHGVVDATADKIEEVETEINQLGEKVAEIGENGTGGSGALRVWMQGLIGEQPTESQLADNVRAYNALMNRDAYSVEALVMMHDVGTAWGVERYLVGGVICISEAQVVQIELFTSISEEEYKVMPFYLYSNGSISLEAIEQ